MLSERFVSASYSLVPIALVVALLAFSPTALAQSTGAIRGVVSDPSGAVVPGATITVISEATEEKRTTSTNDVGLYLAPSLPVGVYSISVDAKGLAFAIVTGVKIVVGSTVLQNFSLAVAPAAQRVEVTAANPVVDGSTVSVGDLVTQQTVQDIPLNGRHFVDLGLLTAGTVTPPTNGYITAPLRGLGVFGINTAGSREDTTNFMINGVNLNDQLQNQITFQPSINTVQEFKIDNSTFSAEYGRNSGAVVNIATRAGTNRFQGELFEYVRNNWFDARNFFNPVGKPQAPFVRNNFGADAGGPIRKNSTFFFLSYEALRQRQGLTVNQQVLTGAQRQQAQSIGNPTVLELLPLIPAPNSGASQFLGSVSAPVDIDQGTANISHTFRLADWVNWYFAFQDDLRQEPTSQATIPGFGDSRHSHRQLMTINETHVFAPNLVNEARLGYNRIFIAFEPLAALNPADFGMNVGVNTAIGLPLLEVLSNGLEFGGPSGDPNGRGDYTAVLSDTLSYVRGKHSVKFGGEVRRFNGNSFNQTPGILAFNTLNDLIDANALGFSGNPSAKPARIFERAAGAFIQDSYRILPSLTLELGLRYDWIGAPTEAENRLSVFVPSTVSLVQVGSGIGQIYASSAKNFQPRIGLAWDVFHNGKTILRSAYAILTDQPATDFAQSLAFNPPFATPLVFSGGGMTFANEFALAKASGPAPTSVVHDFTAAYMQDWNFNIQQQAAPGLGIMIGYFGTKGTHLREAANLNQFLSGTNIRPYPELSSASPVDPQMPLGNIVEWESNGNSDYSGLWVTATKRLSRGLQFNASYTWSKSIDVTSLNSQDGPSGVAVNVQDSNNFRADRGLSDFDVRNRFVFSGIYELPFRGARAFQGWQVAGITQLQSGNPVDVITSNLSYTGIETLRPVILGPVPTGIGSAANGNVQYFPSAGCNAVISPGCLFLQPAAGFGNLGRNVIIGPGFANTDFALYKNTNIAKRLSAQLRADCFNIFNRPNFGQPGRIVGGPTSTFGQITSTRFPTGDLGSSRQIQLSMKLIF